MAAIPYPSVLPQPYVGGYSLQKTPSFIQSPTSAKLRNQKRTDDTPTIINVEFRMGGGRKRLFFQWLYDKLDNCKRNFTMPLTVDGAVVVQECRFTPDGIPQLREVQGGVYIYAATIQVRKLAYE